MLGKLILTRKKLFKFLTIVTLVLLPMASSMAIPSRPPGMPNGSCWADPMNNLIIELAASDFPSNQAGAEAKIAYKTRPISYSSWCYKMSSGYMSVQYFISDINRPPSTLNPSMYNISDQLDYSLSINMLYEKVDSPFSERKFDSAGAGIDGGGGVKPLEGAIVGNSGTITFKLRKSIIGGALVIPGGLELGNLYRYMYRGYKPTLPIYRLITEQSFIPVPTVCKINNGQVIDVNFRDFVSNLLTTTWSSSPVKVDKQLSYSCNTSLTQPIKVKLIASAAGFADAISTSNPDLGIVMTYKNQPVPPGGDFHTHLVNGSGSDDVSFVAVKRGEWLPKAGPFTGSAILLIDSL